MTIGQLAKLTDLNVETIRYYESLQLIPKPKLRASGYRDYTRDYVDKVNYIKKAKELGFTLKEIKDLFSLDDCEDVCELATKKLNEAKEKIESYKNLSKRLEALIKECPNKGDTVSCSIIKEISRNN